MDRCIRNPGMVGAAHAQRSAVEKVKSELSEKKANVATAREIVETRDLAHMLETDADFRQMIAREKGWDDPNRCFEFAAYIRSTLPGSTKDVKPTTVSPAPSTALTVPAIVRAVESPANPWAKTIAKLTTQWERTHGQ